MFFDILISLILDYFPMINFILRCLVIILHIKTLRNNWLKIFSIIVQAKSILFILLFNIIVFALVASLLFDPLKEFSNYYLALYNIFLLLLTCNFPDIMLRTFSITKLSIIFFVVFLVSNYIIIQSLLKVLYYTNYLDINMSNTERNIEKLKSGNIKLNLKQLSVELHNIIKRNSLTREEFYKILYIVELNLKNSNRMEEFDISSITFSEVRRRDTMVVENKILQLIRLKRVEAFINIINLGLVGMLLIDKEHIFLPELQLVMFSYFILEYFIYSKIGGIGKIMRTKLLRTSFCIICLVGFIASLTYIIIDYTSTVNYFIIKFTQTMIILRSLRFFILLNSFQEFKFIFVTIHNIKYLSLDLLLTLYSLILLFSTFSSLILGGKIRNHEFLGSEIPLYYHYLNFNDFASSFLTCFALLMLNNINITIEALTYPVSDWVKAYFSIYYLLGILILLNIFQTYILDMYISIKKIRAK
jgi:hypothetical protein